MRWGSRPPAALFILGWMRRNCIDIFHFLAHELKDTENLECGTEEIHTVGAVYNDFDCNPAEVLGGINDEPMYTQSSNLSDGNRDAENEASAPQLCIDQAILEEDRISGILWILYQGCSIDTEDFDVTSEEPNDEYLKKVFRIASGNSKSWENVQFTEEALKCFAARHRRNWSGPDSIHDAWLLCQDKRREWFPYDHFIQKYPRYKGIRKALKRKYPADISSPEESWGRSIYYKAETFKTSSCNYWITIK